MKIKSHNNFINLTVAICTITRGFAAVPLSANYYSNRRSRATQSIDLLKDREAQTIENWFKNMPEVTVVTRDRFSRYATAVANGSPDAIKVADRWHLLKNMGDVMLKLRERKRQEIIAAESVDGEQTSVHNYGQIIK